MANNYLKRRFTVRETVLLCILFAVLLLGLYFGLVFYPIQSRTADLNADLEQLASDRADADEDWNEYKRMKDEIASLEESGDQTFMPENNNETQLDVLTDRFNEILADVGGAQRFGNSVTRNEEEKIVIRTLSINFTVDESSTAENESVYQKTRATLYSLMTTGYRCAMRSLTLSPDGSDLESSTSIGVSVVIEFFERI